MEYCAPWRLDHFQAFSSCGQERPLCLDFLGGRASEKMKLDAKIANDNDHFWPRPQTPRLNHPLRSLWRPQPPQPMVLVPAVISCSELLEELSRHLVPSHGAFPIHVLSHLANSNGKWHLRLMSGLRATTPKPTYKKPKPTPVVSGKHLKTGRFQSTCRSHLPNFLVSSQNFYLTINCPPRAKLHPSSYPMREKPCVHLMSELYPYHSLSIA